jgi:hypothetical protein
MATLDFPTSPSVGQQYPNPSLVGQPTYKWDGEKWTTNASNGSGSSSFTQYEYIATAGQTTFSGADISGNTLQYTIGYLEVYLNGNRLNKSDFTASSGSSVVLPALALNDQVTIIALGFSNIAMLPTNNLSDVANAATARTNLGAAPIASPTFTGEITYPGSAWTSFATVVTAGAGSFTSASATMTYKQIGKVLHVRGIITITTVGTANFPVLSLPVSCLGGFVTGRETAVNGWAVTGNLSTGTTVLFTKYDGGTGAGAFQNGQSIQYGGTFEVA